MTSQDQLENFNLMINSAIGIGVSRDQLISFQDLQLGNFPKLISFLTAINQIGLRAKTSLQQHPEIQNLMLEGEEFKDVVKLQPRDILKRWINFHLEKQSVPPIANLSNEISDSKAYRHLLSALFPEKFQTWNSELGIREAAEDVIEKTSEFKLPTVISAEDIIQGRETENLMFMGDLFHFKSGLKQVPLLRSVARTTSSENSGDDEDGTNEERGFKVWLNSLGIQVEDLSEDLRDGLVLLQMFDTIETGCVDWSKVNKQTTNAFKKMENCSNAIEVGKSLDFSLVGIGGKDIFEGNQKLILSILWQSMRHHVLSILKGLDSRANEISDAEIIQWANDKVEKSNKSSRMKSFKDSSLRNGKFLIDLLDAVGPGCVNYSLVSEGDSDQDRMNNAKYCISLARKLGFCVFLQWEDIVELNPKMILTFVGTLMSRDVSSSL
eukprot:TRINITY_DN3073_c0_g2_i6.p1 TRINITY_DN3073_c0_g2~~TRINITY_DN3073_c0_g2_i6.p1  ORF type:complete len:515 (-),score=199.20 TRINITY_DN3073_c0_g2_i6:32-1345(-)